MLNDLSYSLVSKRIARLQGLPSGFVAKPRIRETWTICGLVLFSLLLMSVSDSRGQDLETGARLDRILDESDPLSFNEQPLRSGLESLQETYRIGIVLDRRVDPTRRVSLTTGAIPLRDRLEQLAEAADQGCAFLDWGIYVGPRETAERIATLTAVQQKLIRSGDRKVSRRLLADREVSWPRLSEPRGHLQKIARDFGVQVSGLDLVPYDLWAEQELPEMDFPSVMTLMLAEFGLAYEWPTMGESVRLVPFPERVSLEDSYRITGNRQPPLDDWQEQFPSASFDSRGREVSVDGPIEAHRVVRDWISGKPTRATKRNEGQKVLTLTIKSATLKQATDYLSEQLQLKFVFTPKAQAKMESRVTVDVKEESLEALLRELLDPLELTFEIKASEVRVSEKPE